MLFMPHVQFTMSELRVLREAFAPLHQIEDLFEQFGGPEEMKRAINRVADQRNPMLVKQIAPARQILMALAERLAVGMHAVADPQWITETKLAREQGKVPLVLDPEAAVAVIRETRRHQFAKANDGLRILDSACSYLGRVADLAPEAPGDKYTVDQVDDDDDDERSQKPGRRAPPDDEDE